MEGPQGLGSQRWAGPAGVAGAQQSALASRTSSWGRAHTSCSCGPGGPPSLGSAGSPFPYSRAWCPVLARRLEGALLNAPLPQSRAPASWSRCWERPEEAGGPS